MCLNPFLLHIVFILNINGNFIDTFFYLNALFKINTVILNFLFIRESNEYSLHKRIYSTIVSTPIIIRNVS